MVTLRDDFFDVLKGIAILLVVLGHTIQTFYEGYEESRLFLTIYMFHMPLFIAISGRFLYPSVQRKSIIQYIKSKFQSIYLPSLTYSTICVLVLTVGKLLIGWEGQSLNYITLYFAHGLWYLVVLFILCVAGKLIDVVFKQFYLIGWLLFFIVSQFLSHDIVFDGLKSLIPFFVMGVLLKNHRWDKLSSWLLPVVIILFIVAATGFSFDKTMYMIKDDTPSLVYWQNYMVRIYTGILGILISIFLSRYVQKFSKIREALKNIGRKTLPIYVIHATIYTFMAYLHISTPNIFMWMLITMIMTILCIFIYNKLKNITIINILLFGGRK